MLLAFKSGATLLLEKNALFSNFIAKKIEDCQVTVLPCVPFLIQLLSVASQQHPYDFSSIRMVTNTGEGLSHQHIQKIKGLFPSAAIFSMYGLTECKRCSYVPPTMLDKKWESIGIPMPNLNMWIQDVNGNPVEPNLEGELVISGPTVMMGYWRDQVETAKKIQITADYQKILLTGDRAIMDSDGYFYFKGRKDFIVKFNGAKFNCHDYARQLMLMDGVNRAYLFLKEINYVNQIIVCIETNLKIDKTDELKKELMRQFLPVQRPKYFYFTDQFPALGNGKLNKELL
jgi:acyl-coenzyme A synthetase/AMP-(fatty) acid ligase